MKEGEIFLGCCERLVAEVMFLSRPTEDFSGPIIHSSSVPKMNGGKRFFVTA
jgi:hypothetical protein